MDPIIGGALISGGASLLNGMLQSGQNKQNRKWQSAENQKARDYNTQMWNMNNAYNDPTKQMERLKNAGINPHLAYSQGSPMNSSNAPASSNASSMPAGIAPQVDVNGIITAMAMQANIEKTKAETKQIETQTQGQETLNGINLVELGYKTENIETDLQLKRTEISLKNSNIDVNNAQISKASQEVKNLIATNSEIKARIELIATQKQFTNQQINNLVKSLAVMQATIQDLQASASLKNETAKNQSFIRSNIQADTNNKNELVKQLMRGNMIGDKFDLSNAQNKFNYEYNLPANVKAMTKKALSESGLLDAKLEYQDIINTFEPINQVLNSVDNATNIINPFNTTSTTTNTFDRRGNFQGSTQTKTRRSR